MKKVPEDQLLAAFWRKWTSCERKRSRRVLSILGDFFKNEMNGESFSQALQAGELRQVTVNRKERSAVLVVDFPRFVEYGELKS